MNPVLTTPEERARFEETANASTRIVLNLAFKNPKNRIAGFIKRLANLPIFDVSYRPGLFNLKLFGLWLTPRPKDYATLLYYPIFQFNLSLTDFVMHIGSTRFTPNISWSLRELLFGELETYVADQSATELVAKHVISTGEVIQQNTKAELVLGNRPDGSVEVWGYNAITVTRHKRFPRCITKYFANESSLLGYHYDKVTYAFNLVSAGICDKDQAILLSRLSLITMHRLYKAK